MKQLLKKGISVPEIVGIFAMVGVLCGAITPHLLNVREASQLTKLRFNLQKLRKRIDDYRSRHGRPPQDPREAFADSPSEELPDNPLCQSVDGVQNRVKKIDADPPSAAHVTSGDWGGWLYNPETGGIWADSKQFVTE